MEEYINRGRACQEIMQIAMTDDANNLDGEEPLFLRLSDAIRALRKMDSDDVRQIIFCKDCRKSERDRCGLIYCKEWNVCNLPEEFYCAYGKRRNE